MTSLNQGLPSGERAWIQGLFHYCWSKIESSFQASRLQCQIHMNLVFHISQDEIELKHCVLKDKR